MMRPRPSPPSSSFTAAKRRPVLVQRLPRAFDSIERVLCVGVLRLRRRLFPPRKKSTPRFARGRRRRRRRRRGPSRDDSFARRTRGIIIGASFPNWMVLVLLRVSPPPRLFHRFREFPHVLQNLHHLPSSSSFGLLRGAEEAQKSSSSPHRRRIGTRRRKRRRKRRRTRRHSQAAKSATEIWRDPPKVVLRKSEREKMRVVSSPLSVCVCVCVYRERFLFSSSCGARSHAPREKGRPPSSSSSPVWATDVRARLT